MASKTKAQPLRSLRFTSPLEHWNGDVQYRKATELARAARNIDDFVPGRVRDGLVVMVRETGAPMTLGAYLMRSR